MSELSAVAWELAESHLSETSNVVEYWSKAIVQQVQKPQH